MWRKKHEPKSILICISAQIDFYLLVLKHRARMNWMNKIHSHFKWIEWTQQPQERSKRKIKLPSTMARSLVSALIAHRDNAINATILCKWIEEENLISGHTNDAKYKNKRFGSRTKNGATSQGRFQIDVNILCDVFLKECDITGIDGFPFLDHQFARHEFLNYVFGFFFHSVSRLSSST